MKLTAYNTSMKIFHYLSKNTILLTFGLCLLSLSGAKAQAISGPSSMNVGQQRSFSIPFGDPDITWSVSPTSRAQIIGANGGTSVQIRALSTGTFTVNLSLSNGSDSKTVTVSPTPTPSKPSTPSRSVANCAVTLSRANPPGGVTWYWQTSTSGTSRANALQSFQPTANLTYYLRGRANVTTDIWGPASNGVAVNLPSDPARPVANVGQPSCAVPTGTITISSPITTGNTYSFNGGTTFQTSRTKSNLAPGTYVLVVRNSVGCKSPSNTYVVQNPPSPPSNPTATLIQPTCSTPTGRITITGPTNQINGYSFNNGSTFSTNATLSNAAPGTYTLKVRTFDGCISEGTTVTIANPPATPNEPTVTKTDPNCTTNTGSITITSPTGGGNTYSFDGGLNYQTSTTKTELTAGTYNVRVKNSEGCASPSTEVIISDAPGTPSTPTANLGQPSCAEPTGTITITSPVATGNEFSFDGGTSFQTSAEKSDLAPGNYVLVVRNSAGCESTTATYVVQNPPSLPADPTATLIQPTCSAPTGRITITGPTNQINGYSFNDGATFDTNATLLNAAPGSYNLKVRTFDGCISGATTVIIAEGPAAPSAPVATTTPSSCLGNIGSITITSPVITGNTYSFDGGNTYQTSPTKNNLIAGIYTLNVRNSDGCTSLSTQVDVGTSSLPPAAPTVTKLDIDCSSPTGSITITTPIESGNTYSFDNGLNFQTDPVKSDLSGGNYEVRVKNSEGCISPSTLVTLNESSFAAQPTLGNVVQPICATALGRFTITNYNAAHTYTFTPAAGVEMSGASVFAPAGDYTVTASFDGCISTASESQSIIAPSNSCETTATSGENYIYSRSYEEERSIANMFFTEDSKLIQQITYFDGLGRPIQQIGIDQTPEIAGSKNDIITFIGYDGFGRTEKEFLPYPETDTNLGTFRPLAEDATSTFYDTQKYQNTSNPYSEKKFESSPLNRVLMQAAPGDPWKMGNGHEIEFEYETNDIDEVRLFTVTHAANTTLAPTLNENGSYGQGELSKTVTKDENHEGSTKNHTTEEFSDKRGRVILKRTYADIDGQTEARHDTYYIYDSKGNLTYVLPPKLEASTATLNAINANLDELAYQYSYDYFNRLIEKKIPGKGKEYIIYNKLDQPIMTQDANQRDSNEWLFTKYDAFGRLAYTGKTTIAGSSRTSLQSDIDDFTGTLWVKKGTFSNGGIDVGYENSAFPTGTLEVLTVNHYDDYSFDLSGISLPSGQIYDRNISDNVKGLTTGSKVKVLETSSWITSATLYDDKGRNIYSVSKNDYLNTLDVVKMKIDFVGRTLVSRTEHTRNNTTIVTIDNFTYDHVGRLLAQTQCVGDQTLSDNCEGTSGNGIDADIIVSGYINTDRVATNSMVVRPNATIVPNVVLRIDPNATGGGSGETELIVLNTYDELAQLEKKKVGGDADANNVLNSVGLQTVDYTYNVRSWLKRINNPNAMGDDLFAFDIKYNDVGDPSRRLFNGNISQTVWNSKNNALAGNPASRNYVYTYDPLNRIIAATDNTGHYNLSNVSYDKNGNIQSLSRNGYQESSTFTDMDVLDYDYDSGNKLLKVADTGNKAHGFKDGTSTNDDFEYDINGNLKIDHNKGITSITYNHLNLPEQVNFGSQNIKYVYDATGAKLKRTSSTGTETLYAGNFIYEGGIGISELQFFSHPEGYVTPDGQGGYDYVYNYVDHLGSVRLSYTDADNDGNIDPANEIIEDNSYYPFGLLMRSATSSVSPYGNSTAKRWKYNGNELDNTFNIDTYDFGARNYDPAIGRWMNLDPLAEQMRRHSPYNFAFNNPIYFIDPDGMAPMSPLDDIYLDRNGKEIFRVENDQPDRTFIVKTTKTTKQLYSNGTRDGNTNPISKDAAKNTEKQIKSGNVDGEHMDNTVQIANADTQQEMLDHVSQDDGKGGVMTEANLKSMNSSNFKEFSGNIGDDGKVTGTTSGPVLLPMAGFDQIEAGGSFDFHSHPSGQFMDTDGKTRGFTQPTSSKDIQGAQGTEYTLGMKSQKVYVYDKTGVIAIIPFKNFGNKK
ncbi:DUF6443 domain-containing protein [Maribacter sp. 2308TA10-17]|uniref:DUF6443 domain-containing protein n=1 Tax=Maribacter sp. 2308TA10-17 TaxID=3386276 RepID=UPI0039BC59E9